MINLPTLPRRARLVNCGNGDNPTSSRYAGLRGAQHLRYARCVKTRIVKSPMEMGQLAAEVGQQLQPGAIVYLVGELGAGKTTFVQALAGFFGVTRPVTSSTFVLMSSYRIVAQPSIQKMIHVDLYRLTTEQAQHEPLVAELLIEAKEKERITVIEWADRLDKATAPVGWWMQFEHTDPTTRVVRWE